MAKSLPPLTWFRAFEAAARCLSFTAAAQEIGMTQSAVSQHVKALEMRLGATLFIRRARGLSLTDEGRKLLPQVGSALETLAHAAQSFETGPSENLLTVASSVSVAQWVISPHLAGFKRRAPDIRLRFVSTIWPDDFHNLQADVEIPFGSRTQVGRGGVMLQPNRLIALKAPELAGELAQLPLIEAVGTSDGWVRWRDVVGPALLPQVFVDSYGAALNMAVHGNGVALVSEFLAQSALRSGQLVRAHEAALPSNEGYYIRTNVQSEAAGIFRDWLLDGLQLGPLAG